LSARLANKDFELRYLRKFWNPQALVLRLTVGMQRLKEAAEERSNFEASERYKTLLP
jgi:hypothetical protein